MGAHFKMEHLHESIRSAKKGDGEGVDTMCCADARGYYILASGGEYFFAGDLGSNWVLIANFAEGIRRREGR